MAATFFEPVRIVTGFHLDTFPLYPESLADMGEIDVAIEGGTAPDPASCNSIPPESGIGSYRAVYIRISGRTNLPWPDPHPQ